MRVCLCEAEAVNIQNKAAAGEKEELSAKFPSPSIFIKAGGRREYNGKTKAHKNENMSMRNNLFQNFHGLCFLFPSLACFCVLIHSKNRMISGD
jgi:hypothetical protein